MGLRITEESRNRRAKADAESSGQGAHPEPQLLQRLGILARLLHDNDGVRDDRTDVLSALCSRDLRFPR